MSVPPDSLSGLRSGPPRSDGLRVVHLASLARSGETMLLRALDAHPQLQVVHDLRAINTELEQRLYRLLRVWPLPTVPRWQLDAHLAPGWLRPGVQVLVLKQGVFSPRQRPEGFGLIRNPYAVFCSLWSYDARLAGQTPTAELNAAYWQARRLPRLLAWAEASAVGAAGAVTSTGLSGREAAPRIPLHEALRAETDPVRQFLLYWRTRVAQIRAQQPLTITYESFVAQPAATLAQVLTALGLPPSDAPLQAHTRYAPGERGHGGIDLSAPVRPAPAWAPDPLVPLAPFAQALADLADATAPGAPAVREWIGLYDQPPAPARAAAPPATAAGVGEGDPVSFGLAASADASSVTDAPDFLQALSTGQHTRALQAWQQEPMPPEGEPRLPHLRRGLRLLQAQIDALRPTAAALLEADPLAFALELTLLRKLDAAAYDELRSLLLAQGWLQRAAAVSTTPGPGQGADLQLAPLALALEQLDPHDRAHQDLAARLLQSLSALALGKLFRHPALPRNGQLLTALAARVLDEPASVDWTPQGWFHLLMLSYAILPRPMFDRLLERMRALPAAQPAGAIARRFVLEGDAVPALPALHLTRPRLRVALCLSGQMRGWREASATWHHLGLQGHAVEVFIHTWRDLGRRLPDPEIMPSVRRVFEDAAFAEAYIRAGQRFGLPALQRAYPMLFAGLASRGQVDAAELVQAFGPGTQVVVEDDADPRFQAWDNQARMHYKIHAAQQLAQARGGGHDLVIRLRPDKLLRGPSPGAGRPDWHRLVTLSQRERALFCEEPVGLREGLVMGDQFAAGAPGPMHDYAQAWVLQPQAEAAGWPGFPARFTGHTSLACTCLYQGLRPRRLEELDFGPMAEATRIAGAEVWRLLDIDRPHGPLDELDRMLWAARPAPVPMGATRSVAGALPVLRPSAVVHTLRP